MHVVHVIVVWIDVSTLTYARFKQKDALAKVHAHVRKYFQLIILYELKNTRVQCAKALNIYSCLVRADVQACLVGTL